MKRIWTAIYVMFLGSGSLWADQWPQWRGPKNDGISTEKGLPASWSNTKNILWQAPLPGMGSSTACIWDDKIFFTADDGKQLVALCYNSTGKEEWKVALGAPSSKARGDEGNGASASPSTDGKHVWFFLGNGALACLDFAGRIVWNIDVQERYGKFKIQFGMHSTPVLHEGKLYMQLMHDGGQHVLCFDAATGKEVWKVNRPSDGVAECLHSYASCFIWTNGKEAYLVTHGNDYAVAHSLNDGSEIWRLAGLNPKTSYNRTLRFVSSPLCTPELIIVPSAKGGPVVGVKPNAKGQIDVGSEHEAWRMPKGTPDVPSPLLHDGIVYLVSEKGLLTALDAKSGKEHYSQQRLHNHRHRASPVYADGKLYIAARDGVVTVVKAGKTFELLETNRLPNEDLAASPVVANGRLYLRGFKNLYAIGSK